MRCETSNDLIHVFTVSETGKKIFQEIITRNSTNFMKTIILKIQEIQQTLRTKNIKITLKSNR